MSIVDDAQVYVPRVRAGGRRVLVSSELKVEPRPLVVELSLGVVNLIQASASLVDCGWVLGWLIATASR